MELIGQKLGVKFHIKDKKEYDLGNGIILIRPDAWEHSEGTKEQSKLVNENVNKIEVNPQLATVTIAGENPFFKVGDEIFTHYMAYEIQEEIDLDGETTIIDEEYVIFKIENGNIILPDGYYLGEQIMETEITSSTGLILNVLEKKKNLTVKITHIPSKRSHIALNDVIQSIDNFNYPFEYEGSSYVFLKEEEIVAKLIN